MGPDTEQPNYNEPAVAPSALTDVLAAIRELIAKWEREGAFLNNPKDWPEDRAAGRTYQSCAKELKALLAANA